MNKKTRTKIGIGVLAISLLLNVVQGGVSLKLLQKATAASAAAAATNATTEDNVTIDGQYTIRPAADSVKYNYLYQNSEAATDIYALAARLRTALDSGETAVALKYSAELSDEEKQAVSEMVESISMRLMSGQGNESGETYLSSCATNIDGGAFVFVNIVTYEKEEDEGGKKESTLSEEIQSKINTAVESAFSDYSQSK